MKNFDIEWIDGYPETVQPGMIVVYKSGGSELVGDVDDYASRDGVVSEGEYWKIKKWGWLITPEQLEEVERNA